MRSPFIGPKLLLILVLVVASMVAACNRASGTYSQPSDQSSADPSTLDRGVRQGPQGGTQLQPSDADVATPIPPEVDISPGVGDLTPPEFRLAASWPWFLLGLALGFVLGIVFRRPARAVVLEEAKPETRDDRAA